MAALPSPGSTRPPSGPQSLAAYWLNGECADFIFENPKCLRNPPPWDAMFTPAATFDDAPPSEQGNATVLDVLAVGAVRPEDLPGLKAAVNGLLIDPTLQGWAPSRPAPSRR